MFTLGVYLMIYITTFKEMYLHVKKKQNIMCSFFFMGQSIYLTITIILLTSYRRWIKHHNVMLLQ